MHMGHFYDLNFGMAFTTTQALAVRRRNEMLLNCGFRKEIPLDKGAYVLCIPYFRTPDAQRTASEDQIY